MGPREFVRARVVAPIRAQLYLGLSPARLSASVALGVGMGLIPVPGVSAVFSAGIALVLRLNQVAIQAGNLAVYPVQIALFLPFFRAGEWLFSVEPLPFSATKLAEMMREDLLGTLMDFGWTMVHATVVWLMVAPPLVVVLALALRPVLSRIPLPAVDRQDKRRAG